MESKFRLRSAQLFLTYPQCDLKKEMVLDLLRNIIGAEEIQDYLVAEEKHKNGDDHVHCYFKLKRPVDVTNSRYFDLIHVPEDGVPEIFHGNYQGCRGPKNVIKYCSKADNYTASFDVGEAVKASEGHRKKLGQALLDGKELVDLVKEYPAMLLEFDRI